jgi:hypothetical protein
MPKTKKKLRPMTDSKAYVDFKKPLEHALEGILRTYKLAIDTVTAKLKRKVLLLSSHPVAMQQLIHGQSGPIRQEFDLATHQISRLVQRMRAETYFLAHIGQAEAMARALEKPQNFKVHTKDIKDKPMHDGVHPHDRVKIALDRLRRKVEDALSLSLAMKSDEKETLWRVDRAFPPTRLRPVQPRKLVRTKRTREAQPYRHSLHYTNAIADQTDTMITGFADEDIWGDVLNDYMTFELPDDIFDREYGDKALYYDVSSDEPPIEEFSWEVEQDVTEDFVRQVRAGENDAANENGINDFMWNAILDSHTCEFCCRPRDGMTSAEIESAIKAGTLDEVECDAIVAPGHMKCRCKSEPMTEDMPDVPTLDYASWDDWLAGKGQIRAA